MNTRLGLFHLCSKVPSADPFVYRPSSLPYPRPPPHPRAPSRYGSSPGYGCRSSAIRTTGGRRGLWRTLGRRPAPGTSAGRSRTSRAPRALRRGSAAGPCSSTFPLFGIRRRSGPATRRWCASPRRGGWTSWSSRSTLPREEGRGPRFRRTGEKGGGGTITPSIGEEGGGLVGFVWLLMPLLSLATVYRWHVS